MPVLRRHAHDGADPGIMVGDALRGSKTRHFDVEAPEGPCDVGSQPLDADAFGSFVFNISRGSRTPGVCSGCRR
jgi:hypothetical protein